MTTMANHPRVRHFHEHLALLRASPPERLKLVDWNGNATSFEDGVSLVDVVERMVERIELALDGFDWLEHEIDTPSLLFYPAIWPHGARGPSCRMRLFTHATKMVCASFSLPYGPPSYGGTCVSSDVLHNPGMRLVVDPKTYICHGCYSGSGRYVYQDQQLRRLIRKRWLTEQLRAGTAFDVLHAALTSYLSRPRKDRGVAMNPRFFRIHDSGDFLWGSQAYWELWCEMARAFPEVMFWAPTRDWSVAKFRSFMARKRPPNFILRPSAVHLGDRAPEIEGLDAGTAVLFSPDRLAARWACPAYTEKETASKSCEGARCRRCWLQPDLTVSYHAHGAEMSKKALNRNPQPSLVELYERWSHGNPPEVSFEQWLVQRDIEPGSYSRADWSAALAAEYGDDEAAISDALEGASEWMRPA